MSLWGKFRSWIAGSDSTVVSKGHRLGQNCPACANDIDACACEAADCGCVYEECQCNNSKEESHEVTK